MSKVRFGTRRAASTGAVTPASIGAFDLDAGDPLIAGQNLDNFTTPGTWYCASGTVAAAVTNSPETTTGYKLIVMQITPTRLMQVVIRSAAGAQIYLRYYNGTAWQTWRTITPT